MNATPSTPTNDMIGEPTLVDHVRDKLAAASTPLLLKDVLKGLPKPARPKKKRGEPAPPPVDHAAQVRQWLESERQAGRLLQYPSGAKGADRFWLADEVKVLREAALREAASPKPMKALTTAVGKSLKGTDGLFVERVLRDMAAEGQLFEHPPKSKTGLPLFGNTPPLTPEQMKYRKHLDALVKAVRKVSDETRVPPVEILAALSEQFAASRSHLPERASPTATLPVSPPSPQRPIDLRTALQESYEHLCRFAEFRDRLVELPRLFHETAKRVLGLTVEQFHHELDALHRDWKVELHEINEVVEATERHLAIDRDNRLYYYLLWK